MKSFRLCTLSSEHRRLYLCQRYFFIFYMYHLVSCIVITFYVNENTTLHLYWYELKMLVGRFELIVIIPPPQNVCVCVGGGAILDSLCLSVGRSVCLSVSNSCPLYNSFTNGRISFKLE